MLNAIHSMVEKISHSEAIGRPSLKTQTYALMPQVFYWQIVCKRTKRIILPGEYKSDGIALTIVLHNVKYIWNKTSRK